MPDGEHRATVSIHWRPRHVTTERSAALRAVLEANAGDDDVIAVLYDDRIRLPVTVDASASGLRRAIHEATGADDGGATTVIFNNEEPHW